MRTHTHNISISPNGKKYKIINYNEIKFEKILRFKY